MLFLNLFFFVRSLYLFIVSNLMKALYLKYELINDIHLYKLYL